MDLELLWQEFGADDLNRKLNALFPETGISLTEMLGKLAEGKLWEVLTKTMRIGFTGMEDGLEGIWKVLGVLIALGVFGALFIRFSGLFEKYRVGEISFYYVYLMQTMILIRCFVHLRDTADAALNHMILFMKLMMPAYYMTVGAAVGSVTASAGYQMLLFLLYGCNEILREGFLFLATVLFLVTIMEGLLPGGRMEYIVKLLGRGMEIGLKGILGTVAGIGFLQTALAPALDSLKGSFVQRMITAVPGVGSGAESAMQLAAGAALAVKNSFGIILFLLLTSFSLSPLLQLLFWALGLKTAAAIMGLAGDMRLVKEADRMGEIAFFFLRIAGTGLVLFWISIAVVITAVRK